MNMTRKVLNHFAIGKAILFSLLIMGIGSCNMSDKDNGFHLEEFAIDDIILESIVDSMVEMHLPILQSEKDEHVVSLNLAKRDSVLLFVFSSRKKNEIINRYIYRENKRIMGYINSKDKEVILLSDIDHLADIGTLYGRFIHPTGNKKPFKYMKYPSNLYIGENQDSWPHFELIYDPTYIIYPFMNNRFLSPHITKDPDSEEFLKQVP